MREATQRCLRALAALIVLGSAAANAPAQNLTTYDCEWKWKHDSQVGWSCTYDRVDAVPLFGMPGRCIFTGVKCWDFVSADVENGDGGAIILTLDEIGRARNCGGILTPSGECPVPEPSEEERSPPPVDPTEQARLTSCDVVWMHGPRLKGCDYTTLGVAGAGEGYTCTVTDVWCDDDARNPVKNEGTWQISPDRIMRIKNCGGVFTPGGDCSVHEEATPARPDIAQPVDEEEEAREEKRREVLAQCRSAWEENLECCRTDAMSASEDGTACHVEEPIYCGHNDSCDFDVANWPGKAQWTPDEIRTADNCAGTLRLDGNC